MRMGGEGAGGTEAQAGVVSLCERRENEVLLPPTASLPTLPTPMCEGQSHFCSALVVTWFPDLWPSLYKHKALPNVVL